MRTLIDLYHRFLKLMLGIMMTLLLVPVSMQIFSRYVGFIPRYIWTEELARFCFIWIILLGATIAVRDGTHFTADFLPHPKSRRLEAVIRIVSDFAIFLVALIFVLWGWPLVQFGLIQESEMAELPMVYIYAAWPIAGLSWILFLGERFVDHVRLFRGSAT
ncbi:MAG: TRAP transporter small permease [Ectothiorhodospiraceae bacterium]|nr:TRAP transporter small permease [Ectothiorhodospiraceae bacterium]